MKKYISTATKPLLIVAVICGAIFLMGIALILIEVPNIGLSIGLILMGGFLCILFLACYFVEKSRALIIDTDKIVFPRGSRINGATVFRKTVVSVSDIKSIESNLFKGDGLVAKDTNLYTLRLTDSKKITVTLYAYGKQAETEIVEEIEAFLI